MSDEAQSGGAASGEGLLAGIPPELRLSRPLHLPPPLSESELAARLLELSAPNTHLDEAICFLGGGACDHYVPAIVDALAAAVGPLPLTRDSPQPLLQAAYELQTLFASLTGLDLAAAPLPDGPAALAEAIRTAARATGRREAIIARTTHPRYRAVARTLLSPPIALHEAGYHGGATRPSDVERLLSDRVACVVVEQPNYFGCFEDVSALAAAAHSHGAKLVVKADPIALGLLRPPADAGADLAVADAQPLGSRPACGASAGLLACRAELAPALGGWRVEGGGERFGAVGQGCPVRADAMIRPLAYLAALGGEGLARAAALSTGMAHETQRAIAAIEGLSLRFQAPYFKEFVIECEADPQDVAQALLESNILGALPLRSDYPEMENCVLFAATERRTRADIDMLRHTLELLGDLSGGEGFDLDADDA